ncbi:MAG: SDR family NAD(P)-dependent oxidoreductase, partial [Pseudomonadales bacterium]
MASCLMHCRNQCGQQQENAMQRFDDKTVMITGAASGIGRATALRLASEGGKIFAVDVQEVELQESVELIQAAGGQA